MPRSVARRAVRSYRTLEPLPLAGCAGPWAPHKTVNAKGSLLSVALSLELPPAGVTRHPFPMVPGLSSEFCNPATIRPGWSSQYTDVSDKEPGDFWLNQDPHTGRQGQCQQRHCDPGFDMRHAILLLPLFQMRDKEEISIPASKNKNQRFLQMVTQNFFANAIIQSTCSFGFTPYLTAAR